MNKTSRRRLAGAFAAGAVVGAAAAAWREHIRSRAWSEPYDVRSGRRRFADVGGIRMSWLEQGEGLPVVLLHGIPTSPELWRHVIPRLPGVRVLAWEMVDYGLSIGEGKGRDISVARQADYLASWMRQLGIEKAVVAGHDLGGGVAQILAVRRPELCSGLFLTNAIGYDSWPIPSVSAIKASAPLAAMLPDALFKLLLMSLFYRGHDDAAKAEAAYQIHADDYLRAGGAAALVRQIEHLDVQDTLAIEGQLPALGIPARIAWGEDDQFQTIEYGERFARDLGAPLRRIPGGKHFTPEDHPDVIADEIMALVASVRTGGAAATRG